MDGTNRRLVLGVRVGFCETGRPECDEFPASEATSRALGPGGAVTPFRYQRDMFTGAAAGSDRRATARRNSSMPSLRVPGSGGP